MPRVNPKASEVIANTDYVFAKKVDSFETAYPTIEKMQMEVVESAGGFSGRSDPWYFSEKNFRHAIDCSNASCFGGGVEVGWILHDIVHDKKTDFEVTKHCRGYEGTKTRKDRSCLHFFRVKIHVDYKQPPAQSGAAA